MNTNTGQPVPILREGVDAKEQLTSTQQATSTWEDERILLENYYKNRDGRPPVPPRSRTEFFRRRPLPVPPAPISVVVPPIATVLPPSPPPRPWNASRTKLSPESNVQPPSLISQEGTPVVVRQNLITGPAPPPPRSDFESGASPPPEYNSWPMQHASLSGRFPYGLDNASSVFSDDSFNPTIVPFTVIPDFGKGGPPPPRPPLSFPRYGPPSTLGESNPWFVDEADSLAPPVPGPESPTPPAYIDSHDPISYGSSASPVVVQLGDDAEGDAFLPPLGKLKKLKPPASWRPDYSRSGMLTMFTSIMRRRPSSMIKDYPPAMRRRKLADSISWRGESLEYDLRYPPSVVDATTLAATPSASWMRLYHPALPWYIEIVKTNPRGITVLDVLRQIHQQLMVPLTDRDVWNEEISDERRAGLAQGCRRRAVRGPDGVLQFSGNGASRRELMPALCQRLGKSRFVFSSLEASLADDGRIEELKGVAKRIIELGGFAKAQATICDNMKRRQKAGGKAQTVKTCSRCHSVVYCFASCQRDDWVAFHRDECTGAAMGYLGS
ncbi:hypothetical protein NMY22_g2758 [Coprinellus aureogranulatus]|nr:hypothetical protein NMY22_g2758 [Coprinellus aureogranulatus]